jgi:hypothetical protein
MRNMRTHHRASHVTEKFALAGRNKAAIMAPVLVDKATLNPLMESDHGSDQGIPERR